MASLHKQFRKDNEMAWVLVAPNVQFQVTLLDTRSVDWSRAYNRISQPHRKELQYGQLDPKIERELLVRTFVEVCLRGWRTVVPAKDKEPARTRPEVEINDGQWEKYAPELAVRILTSYPPLYSNAVEGASELANFQVTDDDAKNLPPA